MKFTFFPVPNGIYFEIQNLTNENIFLLWDGSYFIDPTNNSSKALNTDILNTENKVLSKDNNESIIPKKGTFRRFTTSAKNVSIFQNIDVSKFYITPNLSIQNTTYNEVYLHNPYWITSTKLPDENYFNTEMYRMKSYIQSNNNLGLGFTFKKGEKQYDYDFKIKIDKVIAYTEKDGVLKPVAELKTDETNEDLKVSDKPQNKINFKNDFLILPNGDTMFVKIIKADENGIFFNKINDLDNTSVMSYPRKYLHNKAFFKDGSPVWILNN
jgi:hypothetical protein